jgi:hypothetical protein
MARHGPRLVETQGMLADFAKRQVQLVTSVEVSCLGYAVEP